MGGHRAERAEGGDGEDYQAHPPWEGRGRCDTVVLAPAPSLLGQSVIHCTAAAQFRRASITVTNRTLPPTPLYVIDVCPRMEVVCQG